jgi:hypothetical protein
MSNPSISGDAPERKREGGENPTNQRPGPEAAPAGARFRPEFITIPYEVFADPRLSHAAKLTYGRLKLYAGKDGLCCPKHETLAREVCISDRQLRTVLSELKDAGWIDWSRIRTSCVYTISSDRKKTSDLAAETGRKLPIRSEENFRSRSEENFRHKRSIEKKLEKRSLTTCSSAGADEPVSGASQPAALFPVEPPAERTGPDGLTPEQEGWFTQWWAKYWRKVAKKPARAAFRKAVRTEARFLQVMAATQAQEAEMLTREPSKRPHGATWLNGERWDDQVEDSGPPVPRNGGSRRQSTAEAMLDRAEEILRQQAV